MGLLQQATAFPVCIVVQSGYLMYYEVYGSCSHFLSVLYTSVFPNWANLPKKEGKTCMLGTLGWPNVAARSVTESQS